MLVVVDASVAAKWFFAEPGHRPARELAAGNNILIAPDLIVAEVCSVAWKKVAAGEGSLDQARALAIGLPGVFRELVSCAALLPQALDLAFKIRHPVYDCFYVALAELVDADFATADSGLARSILRHGFPRGRLHLVGGTA